MPLISYMEGRLTRESQCSLPLSRQWISSNRAFAVSDVIAATEAELTKD